MTEPAPLSLLRTAFGVLLGMLAVAGWGIYNVGVEIGQTQGFRPADLTVLRFGVGALVLLPWFVWRGWRLDQRRLILLALVVGPVFALLFNAGFALAPLAHAVVIGPGMSVLVALLLVRVIDGQRIGLRRMLALGVLVAGLVVIGMDRGAPKSLSGPVLLGDLCFVATGSLWGIYSYLLGRWKMPPVETTAGIALYASAVFVPAYLLIWGIPERPLAAWAEQAVYQGLIGGSGALVAFAAAVAVLGTGRSAVFNALVPPSAVLMAIPMVGLYPNPVQWLGVGLATTGLMLSLNIPTRRRGLPLVPPTGT